MVYYPPSGYVIFSLRNLKFYEGRRPDMRTGGRGLDKPKTLQKSLRYEIVSLSHSEWYSGHFGIFKIIRRINNNYWWSTVKEDVTNFISTCKICSSIKTPNRPCGKMGRKKWPTAPLELISLEFLVNLSRTTEVMFTY